MLSLFQVKKVHSLIEDNFGNLIFYAFDFQLKFYLKYTDIVFNEN